MKLSFRETCSEIVTGNIGDILKNIALFVLPGVLVFQLFSTFTNDWMLHHPSRDLLFRLTHFLQTYLILVPSILVGCLAYLGSESDKPTVAKIYFQKRTPALVIVMGTIFFVLPLFNQFLGPFARMIVSFIANPFLASLFLEYERGGFAFYFVSGLFNTLAFTLAVFPAVYLCGRFSPLLPRFVAPVGDSSKSSWSLTGGMFGVKMAVMLLLTFFVHFVLQGLLFQLEVFVSRFLPIGNELAYSMFFGVLGRLPTVTYVFLMGAIIGIAFRHAQVDGCEDRQAG